MPRRTHHGVVRDHLRGLPQSKYQYVIANNLPTVEGALNYYLQDQGKGLYHECIPVPDEQKCLQACWVLS